MKSLNGSITCDDNPEGINQYSGGGSKTINKFGAKAMVHAKTANEKAGNFKGMNDLTKREVNRGISLSEKAHAASVKAFRSGKEKDHDRAATAHGDANYHHAAMGNKGAANAHILALSAHSQASERAHWHPTLSAFK
jgi:hypothetical protein